MSSIGLTEHIGAANCGVLHASCLEAAAAGPAAQPLHHPADDDRDAHIRGFIDRYVFPDGELEGVGLIISAIQDNGFEVRHEENLREHYARTLRGWCANLDDHWDEAVAEVGLGRARVWGLYMAGLAARLRAPQHRAAPGAGGHGRQHRRQRHAVAPDLG